MSCHSCGEFIDCKTPDEELLIEEYHAELDKQREDQEYALYLRLKEKFAGRDNGS
jgi:hypothetical protein